MLSNRWTVGALALTVGLGLACNRAPHEPENRAAAEAPAAAPRPDDSSITTSIQAKYYADDVVRGRNIDVSTDDGVVRLEGTVMTDEARQRAVSLAQAVDGVTRVDDQLTVRTGETAAAADPAREPAPRPGPSDERATGTAGDGGDRIEAAWITTKINGQYFVNRDLSPFTIDVTTSSAGIVTLSGEVDSAERKAEAVRIARETDGVTRVEDRLRVKGAAAADRESAGGIDRPDVWLTTKVQAKYFIDPDVKGRNIDVDTSDGVVTLAGDVGSEAERRQAVALAQNTDGVRSVTDRLQVRADAPTPDRDEPVRPVRSLEQATRDARITATIQSKYFLDQRVKGHEIDVDTRKGVVTLKGTVSDAALKQEAERIASETSGVSRVVNQLAVAAG